MTSELPYQRSDEFDQELYLRPISDNGRRFLRIMFQAANGTPPEGCEGGIVQRTRFWLIAEQIVLADLLGVARDIKPDSRTKAVRRTVEELENLGIVKRSVMVDRNEDGKPIERLYYVLCLVRLMDLPEIDLNTPAGRVVAHLLQNDPFAEESTTQKPLSGPVSGGLSGALSPGLSGGLSGPSKIPAPVPAPVLRTQQLLSPVPDQEQDAQEAGASEDFDSVFGHEAIPQRSFSDISEDEVRWIGGFSPQGKTPSIEIRRRMFLGYFRDAVTNGFARVEEADLLASVFASCARRMTVSADPKVHRVRDPTDWIRTVWINRSKTPPKVSSADRRIANQLLQSPAAAQLVPS